jgi:HEAT repeat protein
MSEGSTLELDPLTPKVGAWLTTFARALKGRRVYADNNETLIRYIERTSEGLDELLQELPELSLIVREDRILFQSESVWVDADRIEGLPFLLYRNAFRRLTFLRGMDREELDALLRAIVMDYGSGDALGEDLVTALWRLQLPHLRYVTIDTLTTDPSRVNDPEERREIERLQGDVEALIAKLYAQSSQGDDIVSGLSITKEDLEALKQVREEPEGELDDLERRTARAVLELSETELEQLREEVGAETRDGLIGRTMDVLIRILFKEQSSSDAMASLELLQQLMDSMLVGQRFRHATQLVRRLHEAASDSSDLQTMHVARQLLTLFASPKRLVPVLAGLNDRLISRSVSELVGFIRALGPPTVPALLTALAEIDAPLHRRVIRDLIRDLGVPSAAELSRRMDGAEWFVARDLLQLAESLPADGVSAMVNGGLHHGHPRVREQAVKMLRNYGPGLADHLLVARFDDEDAEVRRTAVRVAVARRSAVCREPMERRLQPDVLTDLDPKEQRLWTTAYAALMGAEAVPVLSELLPSGLLSSFRSTEIPMAAVAGLAQVKTEAALLALQRGQRSLVPKVREACRRALERFKDADAGGESSASTDLPDPSGEVPAVRRPGELPPFSLERPSADAEHPVSPHVRPTPTGTAFHQTASSSETMPALELTEDLVLTEDMPDGEASS